MKISSIFSQEILDSRGNPTIESEIVLENGIKASAAVPSGASTGSHEAHELRDNDPKRYGGKGVLQAVANVNDKIAPALKGMDVSAQNEIDETMLELDGTENKENLGANAILSVSMAATKAAALSQNKPLYAYVAQLAGTNTDLYQMPIPMMNVLNGGKHASNSSDMQEYMVMPVGAPSIVEAVRWGAEIFHTLGKLIKEKGMSTSVGDEGGYAPPLGNNEAPLEIIMAAIEKAGYKPGEQVAIAMDPAASEFYQDGKYNLATENKLLSTDELVARYQEWLGKYPIVSIEDCFAEDDWDGFAKFTQATNGTLQIVGDDLFVTNYKRLQMGIDKKAGNSILIKVNQIGTISETIKTIKLARAHNFTAVVSHRSGETEDSFIADFVVGMGTGQIKTGSLCRSERICKYNQLMRIERELENKAQIAKFLFGK
ncbi:phosphopyruvate hydratase [Candidatus Beckwithbacteria bacterium]|nr:phosphopyruvate hydratase [Candidatus Beckwithbacteria bacterium]